MFTFNESRVLSKAYNNVLMQAGWKQSRHWPYAFDEMFGWGKMGMAVGRHPTGETAVAGAAQNLTAVLASAKISMDRRIIIK